MQVLIFADFCKHMNKYPDNQLVKKCLLQIEEKLGWGSSDQWHSEVFIELSEQIQQATDVLLSSTTLKRVWGKVNYQNSPSINTLNTLAQFAGYTNWRHFKISSTAPKEAQPIKKPISNLGIIMTSAAFMTLLFISLFSMIGTGSSSSDFQDLSRVQFSSRPITEGLPNSVVFDFDLDGLESDSIYIQQFWDPTKTIKIKADQKQATGIYYFPGYYNATLLVDGQAIRDHDLFIKTDNWVGTIDYEPVPKYIYAPELLKGRLSFPPLVAEEIKSSPKPIVSSFHLINDFKDLSADHFLMETSIQHVYHDKWAVCQSTKIVILGTTGAMIIPFSIPGCVSDIGLLLNDVYLSGKKHDLSAFGFDFSDYRKIAIQVKEKGVNVFVDGKPIYSGSYNHPVGRFVGIRYRFSGVGEVKDLIVKNDKGRSIIEENFEAIQ